MGKEAAATELGKETRFGVGARDCGVDVAVTGGADEGVEGLAAEMFLDPLTDAVGLLSFWSTTPPTPTPPPVPMLAGAIPTC